MENIKTLFISSQEVIDLAFKGSNLSAEKITETDIRVAQERYFMNALGDDFYFHLQKQIKEEQLEPKETLLIDAFIKPALAHFVKYVCLPDLTHGISNSGVHQLTNQFGTVATDKQRKEMRLQAQDNGDTILKTGVEYISQNLTAFSLYRPKIKRKTTVVGGWIF